MKPLIGISTAAIASVACVLYIVNVKNPEIKIAAVYDMAACDDCNLIQVVASSDTTLIGAYLTPRGTLAEQAADLAIKATTAGACLSGQIYRFNLLARYIEPYDYRFEVTGLLDMTDCPTKAQTYNENALRLLDHSADISDPNKLGCEMPSTTQLEHLLLSGVWIDGRELHDHHSLTLCTITGRVQDADQRYDVTIDFGGVVYFKDGRILACQENCCKGGFELCTFDVETEWTWSGDGMVSRNSQRLDSNLQNVTHSLETKDGLILSGHKIATNGDNIPYLVWIPETGAEVFETQMSQSSVQQLFEYKNGACSLLMNGQVMQFTKDQWVDSPLAFEEDSFVIATTPDLIVCRPQEPRMNKPSRAAYCRAENAGWSVALNWTQFGPLPSVCDGRLSVVTNGSELSARKLVQIDPLSGEIIATVPVPDGDIPENVCELVKGQKPTSNH